MSNTDIFFTGLCTVLLWSLGVNLAVSNDGAVYDLCSDSVLELSDVGDRGRVEFSSASLERPATNPCIIKVTSCSSCRIRIKVNLDSPFNFICNSHWESNYQCKLGCDYVYIFDVYYMNTTLRYFTTWYSFEELSESSNIFIGMCHGYHKNYTLSIDFLIERKSRDFVGSPTYKQIGYIMSPFFPKGYSQNQETYEYHLTNTLDSGYVRLVFDDWHLAPTTDFFFVNSNIASLVSGESRRPMVLSTGNRLTVKFRTGSSLDPTHRTYLGFKATYTFLRDEVPLPRADCKDAGYIFTSYGGYVEFSPTSKKRQLYDCLWVLKKMPGYTGVQMKVIRFSNPGWHSRGENRVEILSGLTSHGYTVTSLDQLDNVDNGLLFRDTQGFYIRLNGSYDSSDTFSFVYASYKIDGCTPGMFECSSQRVCIHSSLKCDRHNNCGDNSDETTPCGDDGTYHDKSYQYTITIGVIIPMVISVFLIMVICLLFVMIRRCRRARMQEAGSSERLRTLSEDVSRSRGRRRRRHRRHIFGDRDLPPTYDEAMQNPPGWYLNVAFANPVDPSLPQPPTYTEAVGQEGRLGVGVSQHRSRSPASTYSSQSELTVGSHNASLTSSSSDDEGDTWGNYEGSLSDGRRARRSRHISSSSSETEETTVQSSGDSTRCPQRAPRRITRTQDQVASDQSPRASPSSERSEEIIEQDSEHKVGDQEKVEKEKDDELESKHDPKKDSSPSEFVIPDSAKVENEHTATRSYASRLVQSVLGSKSINNSNRSIELREGGHTRNRSMSSESEAVPEESRRRGKKKPVKPKRGKGKKGKPAPDRSAPDCPDEPYHVQADHVPCTTAGASNFHTEHVQNQHNVDDSRRTDKQRGGNYFSEDGPGGKGVESGGREPRDYEMVVNVDNEDVMLVYDTNFCEIPQHRDHFSQSQSAPDHISRSLSSVAMETEASGGGTSDATDVAQSQHVSDRSDSENSPEREQNCDVYHNHGDDLGNNYPDEGEAGGSGHDVPVDVRYISFTDDVGDDIYV